MENNNLEKINNSLEVVDERIDEYEEALQTLKSEIFNQKFKKQSLIQDYYIKKNYKASGALYYFDCCMVISFIVCAIILAIFFPVAFAITGSISAKLILGALITSGVLSVITSLVKTIQNHIKMTDMKNYPELLEKCRQNIESMEQKINNYNNSLTKYRGIRKELINLKEHINLDTFINEYNIVSCKIEENNDNQNTNDNQLNLTLKPKN